MQHCIDELLFISWWMLHIPKAWREWDLCFLKRWLLGIEDALISLPNSWWTSRKSTLPPSYPPPNSSVSCYSVFLSCLSFQTTRKAWQGSGFKRWRESGCEVRQERAGRWITKVAHCKASKRIVPVKVSSLSPNCTDLTLEAQWDHMLMSPQICVQFFFYKENWRIDVQTRI